MGRGSIVTCRMKIICYPSLTPPPKLLALKRPNLLAISLMLLLFDRYACISTNTLLNPQRTRHTVRFIEESASSGGAWFAVLERRRDPSGPETRRRALPSFDG